MHKYKKFNIIFISFILLAIISILVLDVVADRLEPKPIPVVRPDDELGWVFTGSRNQVGFSLRFNDLGVRGGEITVTPVKLLLLGNSVTLGQHVPENKTFAGILGAVNAGQDGYDTFQQLKKYKRDLYELKPERVGLIVSGIDVRSEKASQKRIKMTLENNRDLKKRPVVDFNRALSLFRPKVKTDAQAGPSEKNSDVEAFYLRSVSTPVDPDTWKEWTDVVLRIKNTAGNNRFFIVLSPPRSQVIAYQKGEHDFWLNKNLEEFSRENNIQFIDLLPALVQYNTSNIYIDQVHFNETGHSIVAGEIAKRI